MGNKVAVIGTVFTDIKGFARDSYNLLGRNLGKVEICQGGVGRNVAENMANVGIDVTFISSVDRGMLGDGVVSHLKDLGVDTSGVAVADENGMGLWMLINNNKGEQVGSLSQLPLPEYTEAILAQKGDEIFADVNAVALEYDVSEKATELVLSLAEKYGVKVYGLPATMDIVMKCKKEMSRLHCFICNEIEAGKLFDVETEDYEPSQMLDLVKNGMNDLGLAVMIVTMGAKGAVYADSTSDSYGFVQAQKVSVVDTSGAGDAFFSGTVSALIKGLPIEQAVEKGTQLSALTIQCKNCNCDRELCKDLLE